MATKSTGDPGDPLRILPRTTTLAASIPPQTLIQVQTPATRRRDWLPPVIVLILLALIGTIPFWLTDLDVRAATLFYHPTAEDPWFQSREPLWLFLYQTAPLLIGLAAMGSLAVLAAGTLSARHRRLRPYAAFLIVTVVLGPGLMVNAVLKDQWGRPRPHQTAELGGTLPYLPPLAVGDVGNGKSFPCGHASAGFMLGAFWLIWRRRRPKLARLALLTSILLGGLLGVGRMTAGDHFLSDVIWSAVIVYGLAVALYYGVFRIPQWEDALSTAPGEPPPPLRRPVATAVAYGTTGTVMLSGVLLATPVHENRSIDVVQSRYDPPPRTLRLVADEAQVSIAWHDWHDRSALILVKGRGFGMPGTRVRNVLQSEQGILTMRIEHRGIFTEKDTSLVVGVVARDWDRIEVETDVGNIRVHPVPASAPALDLKTRDGQVLRDAN